jgi:hypothetical protein
VLAALALAAAPARGQAVRDDFVFTNGTVNAVALRGDTLYVGGGFTAAGSSTGSGVPIDVASGLALSGHPRVVGQVLAAASDGAGGWYLGGAFTSVGGEPRAGLAHIRSDLSVAPWNPGVSGTVLALLRSGDTLYVGGTFTSLAGEARANLGAVDAVSGLARAWNPGASGAVRALAAGDGAIVAGGAFTSVGGAERSRLASIDPSGLVTAWNPGANSTVRALLRSGASVIAGGDFSSAGGQGRARLAEIDLAGGFATAWNPGASGSVAALAAGPGVIYAGGAFTVAGGQPRNRIAALDAATGLATPWNPGANAQVLALAEHGGVVYAGGEFTSVAGSARSRLAALDAVSGSAVAWDPTAYGTVSVLAAGPAAVFAGGAFNGLGGAPRRNLAAVDAATGALLPWSPDVDDEVLSLALDGGVLYVGGLFAHVGGTPRNHLAAVDLATAAPTAWNPNADGAVTALVSDGARVYAGGLFGTVGGQVRAHLAAIDAGTGLATVWNPGADGQVFALARTDGDVLVGGSFASAGGLPRANLAAIDAGTGLPTPWNPGSNGTVRAIAPACGAVVVGGFFTTLGGQPRVSLAALDEGSGAATAWNPAMNGPVFALALEGGVAYAGGIFSLVGGQPRNRLAAIDLTTGLATAWNPNAGGTVRAIAADPTRLFAGGSFTGVGGAPVSNLAAMDTDSSAVCPAIAIAPGALPSGVAGVAYAATVGGAGGTAPYCFAVTAGALPAGLALDRTTGQLAGTPQAWGSFPITVTAVDAVGCRGSAATVLDVACPAIAVLPASLADAVAGYAYAETLTAPGATPPLQWTVVSGALPPGLALDPASGVISGVAAVAGNAALGVAVRDAHGCEAADDFTLSVLAMPPVSLVDARTAGRCLSDQHPCVTVPVVYARGDSVAVRVVSVTFQIDAARLALCTPLDPASSIRQGPWLDAFGNHVMQVVDHGAGRYTVDQAILGQPCGVETGGVLFTVDLAAVGPDGPAAITVTDVRVRDCFNAPVGAIPGPVAHLYAHTTPIVLNPPALAGGAVGVAHAETLSAGPGTPPIVYAVTAGALPAGLTLSAGGILSGIPVAYGDFPVTVSATDGGGCVASRTYLLSISCPPIEVLPAALPHATLGQPYAQGLSASAGAPPHTFSVAGGALPGGLALSGAGLVSGAPGALGAFPFDVRVSDAATCADTSALAIVVSCPTIAILPPALDDAIAGAPYSRTLSASAGVAPFTWAVVAGALPGGLMLDPETGEIAGTPPAVGNAYSEIQVTDAAGCSARESFTLSVLDAPPASSVGAAAGGLCLSTAHACVAVPFVYSRGESASVRVLSVTFELDPARLALCTPGDPGSSIHQGPWLDGFGNTVQQVIDHGGGRYTVDQAILGDPCGATGGGVAFTVDVRAVGPDGAGLVTVTEVRARDCDNLPIGVAPGAPAAVTLNHAAPAALGDLAATQVIAGNPPGATTGMRLTWTPPAAGTVYLYRAPFGAYPEYDDGPAAVPDPLLAPGPPWTPVAAGATPPFVDAAAPRGFWHHVAIVRDACGNASAPSAATAGVLNYHLGDVADGVTGGAGNNRVFHEDLSLLGAHYGIAGATLAARGVAYLDVGPTTDLAPTSRPTTDDSVDFEDLMMFVANYTVASVPPAAARPARGAGGGVASGSGATARGADDLKLVAPSLVAAGEAFEAELVLSGSGRIHGLSAALGWDPEVVKPEGVRSAGRLEGLGGVVLEPAPGVVDAALLGAREGFAGEGTIATVRFRALRAGLPGIVLARVKARDGANRPVGAAEVRATASPLAPTRVELLAPWPNPARGGATVVFALPAACEARLEVFDVDGRRVRTLAAGPWPAGAHRLSWDGSDARGAPIPPGVYLVRLAARGAVHTRRLVVLR